ncbi:MAG: rhodanese-like domain-containing protein [Chitinophagia bacterium]|jgi:rhodanese-related sulfurtransferase
MSCAQNNPNKSSIELTISTTAFSAAVKQPGAQILDVRTAGEYQSGHIANALQANWLDPKEFKNRTQYLDKSKIIYIYCQSGGRSASAQAALMEAGFKVVNLEGGISNWRMQQMPVEGAGNAVQMRVVDFEKLLQSNQYVLVDIGAVWCPPCRKMQPVMDALKQTPPKPFYFLAVDGGQDMDVMKLVKADDLPTFILYKNGVEVWRKVGVAPKDDFVKAFGL